MSPQRSCPPPNAQLLKLQHRRTELDNAIRLLEEIMLIRLRRSPEMAAIISKVRQGRVSRKAGEAACPTTAGCFGFRFGDGRARRAFLALERAAPIRQWQTAEDAGRGTCHFLVQFPPDLILSARTLRHTRSHSLRHCRPCRIARHRPQTPHLQDWCRWMSRPESLAGSKRIP